MNHQVRYWLAVITFIVALAPEANAEPASPDGPAKHEKCPRPSYCCLHYWLPSLYTCRAYHKPLCYVMPPVDPADAAVQIVRYPCPLTSPSEQSNFYLYGRPPAPTVPEPASGGKKAAP